jgi:site-specific recombinase XerD
MIIIHISTSGNAFCSRTACPFSFLYPELEQATHFIERKGTMSDLTRLIDGFILTVEANGNVESEATVIWNRRRMELYARFVKEKGIDDPLTAQAFRQYAVYLKHRPRFDHKDGPLSVYYRRGCIQVLKKFGRWLYQEGHTTRNLGEVLSLPRLPSKPRLRSINLEDIEKMIAGCTSLRDRTMLIVLRDTGCRAEELIDMRWCDVDLESGEIIVTGKRRETRIVYLSPRAVKLMTAYKEKVPHGHDDSAWWGYLDRKDCRPLSYRGFYSMMYRLANSVGVKGRWNPHSWRHAYGRNLTRNGCPTVTLSDLMGHTTTRVTKWYSTMDDPELKESYQRYSQYK